MKDKVGTDDLFPAQHAALKLADEQRTRSWRQLAQKMPQPLDGRLAARHSRWIRIQAFRLDTVAALRSY
jgi:hypothetical protein